MTVLEITSGGVHRVDAARPIDRELAHAALDWIDDPFGLYEGRPVAVAELWRRVMSSVAGESCDSIVVVHPDDWPPQRVRRVTAAANAVAGEVVAVRRGQWRPAAPVQIPESPARPRRRRPILRGPILRGPILLGLILLGPLAAVITGIWLTRGVPVEGSQTVTEGRIEVQLPAGWTVTRVTGGPGSRRLQAGPDGEPDVAVHITQAYAPDAGQAEAATSIGRAIAEQPAGVFVDFQPAAQAGGRPAVTYRELRGGQAVEWAIVQAGSARVGVGCQGTPQRIAALREICAQVAASVRERGTDPAR